MKRERVTLTEKELEVIAKLMSDAKGNAAKQEEKRIKENYIGNNLSDEYDAVLSEMSRYEIFGVNMDKARDNILEHPERLEAFFFSLYEESSILLKLIDLFEANGYAVEELRESVMRTYQTLKKAEELFNDFFE